MFLTDLRTCNRQRSVSFHHCFFLTGAVISNSVLPMENLSNRVKLKTSRNLPGFKRSLDWFITLDILKRVSLSQLWYLLFTDQSCPAWVEEGAQKRTREKGRNACYKNWAVRIAPTDFLVTELCQLSIRSSTRNWCTHLCMADCYVYCPVQISQ